MGPVGSRLTEGQTFGFWVSQGGLICPDCQKEEYTPLSIHAGTAAALRVVSGENDAARQRLSLTPQQYQEAKHVTTAALSHILGKRPKMLKYLS